MDKQYCVTDSDVFMRGSSKYQLDSTSNTNNVIKRSVDEEPYTNPNLRNDLSQMNISHLSHNES